MRGQDVLADQVVGSRPPLVELQVVAPVAHGADVVHERVEPDVADIVLVEGQVDAPGHAALRPRDAKVVQRLAQEAERLVAPMVRLDELRVLVDVLDQPLLVLAHPEEVVRFLDLLDGPVAFRAFAVHEVLLHEKPLVRHAVPAVVLRAVNLVAVVQILEDRLDNLLVTLLRRPDKIVVRDLQLLPQLLEADDRAVRLLLRGDARGVGGLLHLLAVLVRAGQEIRRHIQQPVVARQHISDDCRVRVADVRLVVHVVNRGRNVKFCAFHMSLSSARHYRRPHAGSNRSVKSLPSFSCRVSA